MKIREATFNDARVIAEVHIDTWRSAYIGIVPDEYLSSLSYERLEQGWAGSLQGIEYGEVVYVLEDAKVGVIGFARAGLCQDKDLVYEAELHTMYLLQEFQRKGLGKRLFFKVVKRLFGEGIRSLVLWVFADNPTRSFYESLGGECVAERKREIGGRALTEVAYAWSSLEDLICQ